MQIAPTDGAVGTGVSEAKLKPFPGKPEPAAEASATAPVKSPQQQVVIADLASLSELAVANLLTAVPPFPVLSAAQNSAQITPAGSASLAGFSDLKIAPPPAQIEPSARAAAAAAPAKPLPLPVVVDSASVHEFTAADLLQLGRILQPALPPERTARVDALIREAVRAIRDGRVEWAVGRLVEAAATDPARVDEIRSKPELQTIRANVENLLAHLTNIAKMDAESKLASAEQLFEDCGHQKLPHWETAPEALLHMARRLLEAGGYANCVRTAELATTLQSAYWAAIALQPPLNIAEAKVKKDQDALRRARLRPATSALVSQTWEALREELPRKVQAVWRRAPLLVLLAAWFCLGLLGGIVSSVARIIAPASSFHSLSNSAFQVWALGLLALVGLGFWARIRPPRP